MNLSENWRRRRAWFAHLTGACNGVLKAHQPVNIDGVVTIRLSGNIDLHGSPKLRRVLRAKACARTPSLLLDFTEVNRIDFSGLATLMEYYQHAHAYGGRFAVAGLSGQVRGLFDLVRFGDIFIVYASAEEAVERIAQSPQA